MATKERGRPSAVDGDAIARLAIDGLTRYEIAARLGYTYEAVCYWCRKSGIAARSGHAPKGSVERASRMIAMYRQGVTLQKIGDQFKLTRERVRQILEKNGVTASEGGIRATAAAKRATQEARRNGASLARHGLPADLMRELRRQRVTHSFVQQRNNAARRGVAWNLAFADWYTVWQTSGKLGQRGRGKGCYVMSRIRDEGGYELGNVHIQLATDNNRESREKLKGKKANNCGVYCLYPGSARGWVAVYGGKKIGAFASEGEAVIARAEYLKSIGASGRPGRGYSVINSKYGPRYQVMVGRQYVGLYRDAEQALKARAEYLSAQAPSLPEPAKEGASHA